MLRVSVDEQQVPEEQDCRSQSSSVRGTTSRFGFKPDSVLSAASAPTSPTLPPSGSSSRSAPASPEHARVLRRRKPAAAVASSGSTRGVSSRSVPPVKRLDDNVMHGCIVDEPRVPLGIKRNAAGVPRPGKALPVKLPARVTVAAANAAAAAAAAAAAVSAYNDAGSSAAPASPRIKRRDPNAGTTPVARTGSKARMQYDGDGPAAAPGSAARGAAAAGRLLTPRKQLDASRVRVLAEMMFKLDDAELAELLREKARSSNKWDYKAKMAAQDSLLGRLRSALSSLQEQRKLFIDAAEDVERTLQSEAAATDSRINIIEAEHNEALEKAAKLQADVTRLRADLGRVTEREASLSSATAVQQGALAEAVARTEELVARLQAAESAAATAAAEADALREQLSAAQSAAAAGTSRLEAELKAASDAAAASLRGETAALQEQLSAVRSALAAKDSELHAAHTQRTTAETAAGRTLEELARAQTREREAEATRQRLEQEKSVLQADLARASAAAAAAAERSSEMNGILGSLAEGQRAGERRESELKETLKAQEERVAAADKECNRLAQEVAVAGASLTASNNELISLKDQLTAAKCEAAETRVALSEALKGAASAGEGLAVEKELRARAEMREEQERRERTAATAQLMAMEVAQALEVERGRTQKSELQRQAAAVALATATEKTALKDSLRLANERAAELEGEVRTLKEAMKTAHTSAESLEELSRAKGELDVARIRLAALEADRRSEHQGSAAAIAELEAKVKEGELQRRKMHNLIQELRGNVRVFARVRPFLPDDGVSPGASPAITASADGVSCTIARKAGTDSSGRSSSKSDSFSFDKVFPPSAGQEAVFNEVSEFVQSALDGYHVSMLAYGQSNSGKTHTMQGSGLGQMRGIIPRAMEQVGRYKAALEAQGWQYTMQVSFLEIYNEQIRDLLRDRPSSSSSSSEYDGKHEIKRDIRGVTTVTDLSLLPVDPNDSAEVERILELAAGHRSVGSTAMNSRSSRSHSVFTLHLTGKNASAGSALKGALHLVDLAGSERVGRSGVTGDQLKETVSINKSLSSLVDVFTALANKNSHVPFRNSKLTYLLQPALSGEGKTLMLVNLSPTEESYGESLCSLKFAKQVNQCELGKPKRNLKAISSSSGEDSASSSSSSIATTASCSSSSSSGSSSNSGTATARAAPSKKLSSR